MKRIIRLTERDLTRIVKRVLSETVSAPEPILMKANKVWDVVLFDEGKSELSDIAKTRIKNMITTNVGNKRTKDTIKSFNNRLPKFIEIGSRTSSTGSYETNQIVGRRRINAIRKVVDEALGNLGYNSEQIEKMIVTNTDYAYLPTDLDRNIYDPKKVAPKQIERIGYISVTPLEIKGLDDKDINKMGAGLRTAKGYNVNPDEVKIVNQIKKLETYSDIIDLDDELQDHGGLETFINDTITDGWTEMGSDTAQRKEIKRAINKASNRSGKGDIAKIVGDKISILLP